jgi:hypothetical protein
MNNLSLIKKQYRNEMEAVIFGEILDKNISVIINALKPHTQ